MMTEKWTKIVGRTAYPITWSAEGNILNEGIKLGKLDYRQSNDLIIKFDTPLTYVFEPNINFIETNFSKLIKEINPDVDEALQEAENIIEKDLNLLPGNSKKDAAELYKKHKLEIGLMILGYYLSHISFNKLKETLSEEDFKKIEKNIIQPSKKPLLNREHTEIEDIKEKYQKGETKESELKNHAENLAKKYGWIHSEYRGRAWNSSDYLTELKQNILHNSQEENKIDTENLNDYIKWLISITQHCTYIFDEGKSSVVRTNWVLRKTLENLGVNEKEILSCTEEEFLNWTKTGQLPDKKVLEERSKYHAIYNHNGIVEEFSTKESVEKLIKQEGISEFQPIDKNIKEIKGQIANPGVAKGKAVITFSQEDSEKINEGDILVASMTTPELIAGMRKASAFVTDEGGITCHAAIIAREMNKPCIIGTKIATKILNNGDIVELDTNNGIVKILEKAK